MRTINIAITRKLVAQRMGLGMLAYTLMRVKGLVTLPIMTRFLGPDGMGAVSMAGITASMLWPVLTLGLTYGLPVKIVNVSTPAELRKLYSSAINIIAVVTFLVISIVAGFRWLGIVQSVIDRYAPYLLATAVYVVASLAKELALLLPKVLQRTRTAIMFELLMDYGGASAAIVILMSGLGAEAVIWALSATTLGIGALLYGRLVWEFGYYPGIDRKQIYELLIIGLPVIPVSIAQWALQGLDHYFIAYYQDQATVGVYTVGYSVANLTLGLLAVLNYVYFPTLAVLFKRGREHFEGFVYLSLRLTTLVLGLWLLATIVLAKDMVDFLAGAKYADAAPIIPIVVFAFISLTVANLLQQIPVATVQRTIHMSYTYGVSMAVNIGLNFVLIPRFSMVGAAVATAVSYLLLVILMLVAARRHMNFGMLIRHTLVGWVPCAVLGLPAFWLAGVPGSIGTRMFGLLVGIGLFLALAWGCGAVSKKDLATIRAWESGS